jgi:hypothetical protein
MGRKTTTVAALAVLVLSFAAGAPARTPGGTVPPPVVKIASPFRNGVYFARYSTVLFAATVQAGAAGGTCAISWGDDTAPTVVPVTPNGTAYQCVSNHTYFLRGTRPVISVVAADAGGGAVGTDSVQISIY